MNRMILLVAALLLTAPAALAHKPPGPVTTCQPSSGEAYHDYIPPNLGFLVIGGDGNLADCGTNAVTAGPILSDQGRICQLLKQIRDDGSMQGEVRTAANATHVLLCTFTQGVLANQPLFDYDGELDYGHGGVFLAVTTGDALSGSLVCYGMEGHHSGNIYAQEWPDGSGPAFTVTADYSRTPPSPGSKGVTPPDCGDNFVEPCDSTPPAPSTQPFPLNVVIDAVNAQLWALFGPTGDGTTCNVNDCAERNLPPSANDPRSNPLGPTHHVMGCIPGSDGTYVVFIEPDFDAPDAPQSGHVWTY